MIGHLMGHLVGPDQALAWFLWFVTDGTRVVKFADG